ncbi:MAG: hypothetical protein AMXMBFR64_57750 [Myxococcales bacterium]
MLEHLAISESGFLFDARTGHTYTLSRTGVFLVRALVSGASTSELPGRLAADYDVEPPIAARDVEQFLMRMRDLGLLDTEDEP